ncbi:MAG: hypothetical protein KKD39_07945 [Candidatus Altiarchaeota archaeon]|nr:hypothetical protein [Candidatus Altiarchaeota archaeon]
MDDAVERHVMGNLWIREMLLEMDDCLNPVMGISDFDDSVCADFSGRILASTDGPYDKRLVMRSALVHAATDVVVKGGIPLFALDNLCGKKDDIVEMLASLKRQAQYMRIPLIGGNTKYEDVKPTACVTVLGKLLISEPIRDCSAKKGDVIALFGQPIWGGQEERLTEAKKMFDTWFYALKTVDISSAKDVTKGGLVSCIYEMQMKSGKIFEAIRYPYPRSRNLDNFLITLQPMQYLKLERICDKNRVKLEKLGSVK